MCDEKQVQTKLDKQLLKPKTPRHRQDSGIFMQKPEPARSRGAKRLVGGETHQVIDAQLLQLQHDASQVAPEDFRVRLRLQVALEALLGVEAETLAGACASSTTSTLLR